MPIKKRASKSPTTQPLGQAAKPISKALSKPLIFISHDSRDADLAEAFSKLLGSVSAGMLKSFRSSDRKGTEGIEYGVDWYPEVMSKIDSASDVVCLLTSHSVERPWILYEAGVAKGKMSAPVYGVALGISLARAATGPFAQFQNCGDDSDSITKLVMQLMCRVAGAEPDKETVSLQVQTFIDKMKPLVKAVADKAKSSEAAPTELGEASVAKIFEEVKVMFRDLPSRIHARSERSGKFRLRKFDPELIFDLGMRLGDESGEALGILILASMFKDDAPWLYELGVDAYRAISSHNPTRGAVSLGRFASACELAAHHPMFRDLHRNEDLFIALMEMSRYIDRFSRHARNARVETNNSKRRERPLTSDTTAAK